MTPAALVVVALALAAPPEVALAPIAKGFDRPVFATALPARAGTTERSDALVVVEQGGLVRVLDANGAIRQEPFLDMRARVSAEQNEMGLLGLAFHPRYVENGLVFVAYTRRLAGAILDEVARLTVPVPQAGAPVVVDPASLVVVLSVKDPAGNHNGGMLAFGKDGFLYIGTGDGGGANDRFGTSRDRMSLLAKMLRIEPSTTTPATPPYTVPKSNPFVGDAKARPEIWATGLRNPWRYSFDRATGDLYIADVGQNAWEEIHVQPSTSKGGEDYGWNVVEGHVCFSPPVLCNTAGLSPPVHVYGHDEGCSITGGYVYRGSALPALVGAYLFADYCSGRISMLRAKGAAPASDVAVLVSSERRVSSFGEDAAGEILVVDHGGELLRLVPRASTTAVPAPKR